MILQAPTFNFPTCFPKSDEPWSTSSFPIWEMLCSFDYPHQSYTFSNSAITFSEINTAELLYPMEKKNSHMVLHLFLMASSMLHAFLTTVENWSEVFIKLTSMTPRTPSSVRTANSESNVCKFGIVFLQIHLNMTKLSFTCHYPVTCYWEILPLNSSLSSNCHPTMHNNL